jgi:inosine triphosphate pyrophosphatase
MITFITGNPAKAEYLANYFQLEVQHKALDLVEIQSMSLEEIVRDKVQRAQAIVGGTVLVEDVSLTFKALNSLPGPLIKWFFESLGNNGLCNISPSGATREAVAEVAFALCDGDSVQVFKGQAIGTISETPRGDTNFGWDPIFIPTGHDTTWAEMTPDEKHLSSMRKPALEALADYLKVK